MLRSSSGRASALSVSLMLVMLCATSARPSEALAQGGAKERKEQITGAATVIDGDTLDIGGRRLRLHGIDAPERKQSCFVEGTPWNCGEWATDYLKALLNTFGRDVTCSVSSHDSHRLNSHGLDRYGRSIAVCTANGHDLNGWLVRVGAAIATPRYSKAYIPDQTFAKFNHYGIWASEFVEPWKWRQLNISEKVIN